MTIGQMAELNDVRKIGVLSAGIGDTLIYSLNGRKWKCNRKDLFCKSKEMEEIINVRETTKN